MRIYEDNTGDARVPSNRPGTETWDESKRYLPRLEDRLNSALYLRGTLREAARHHLASGGKRLRARLAIAAGLALDLSDDELLSAATAVELVHAASLVHDDLQDGDEKRRGKEAVWSLFGEDVALLLGDALIAAATAEAVRGAPHAAVEASRSLSTCIAQLAQGQIRDTSPRQPATWTPQAYEWIARRKTGRLLALAFDLPLIAAGVPRAERRAAQRALEWLGVAYQIGDDLADLHGTKGRLQASDLRCGRMSAVIVHHLALHREDGPLRPTLRGEGPQAVANLSFLGRIDALRRSDAIPACREHQHLALARSQRSALALAPALRDTLDDFARGIERARRARQTPLPGAAPDPRTPANEVKDHALGPRRA